MTMKSVSSKIRMQIYDQINRKAFSLDKVIYDEVLLKIMAKVPDVALVVLVPLVEDFTNE